MKKYYKTIVFSNSILKTSFRFEDKFQVLPLDMKGKPYSPYAHHFPLFIEYTLDINEGESRNALEITALRVNKVKEILNLLSCLTNHRFFDYDPSRSIWGIRMPNKDTREMTKEEIQDIESQESVFCLALYKYKGLKEDLQIDHFTDFFPNASFMDNKIHEYYTSNPIDDYRHEISFPDTINYSLQNYYTLSSKTRERVNSCIYLACDGIDISDYKRSLSFLSYVSAIEGLIDLDVDDDEIQFSCKSCHSIIESPYKCPKCGRPIWGINQKFTNFLSKFVAGSEDSMKTYKEIYDLRSKITHKGKLFLSDYELSLNESIAEKEHNAWLMRLKTLQLFRIALDSWLRYNNKKKH